MLENKFTRIKLLLSYDGTEFWGWQRQSEGGPTIQGTLEEAVKKIFGYETAVVGSGRTDRGVHAYGQVAHFDIPADLPKERLARDITHALNCVTPESLSIKSAWIAPQDFHAIHSSVRKTYIYRIWNSPQPDALNRRYTTWIRENLDLDFLNLHSQELVGEHDFKSFQSSGTELATTVRTLDEAKWVQVSENIVEFRVSSDGFLKQMVRNIVGTLLDLHKLKSPTGQISAILAAKDRRSARFCAKPEGLHLLKVEYPQDLDFRCQQI